MKDFPPDVESLTHLEVARNRSTLTSMLVISCHSQERNNRQQHHHGDDDDVVLALPPRRPEDEIVHGRMVGRGGKHLIPSPAPPRR